MRDHTKPDYVSIEFPDPPPDRPYVFTNMVMSADGKVVIEGTERGLGSPIDQRLMRELRVHADVVLNGAGTLRKSGTSSLLASDELVAVRRLRGRPPAPVAAVLSASGDLPLERPFFTSREFPAVVYLASTAPPDRAAAARATGRDVIEVPADDPIPAMLHHMHHSLGARRLLVEGGPEINGRLFDLGVVDEYFLTIGPRVVGGNVTLTPVRSSRPASFDAVTELDLLSAVPNPATGELYVRYRRRRAS